MKIQDIIKLRFYNPKPVPIYETIFIVYLCNAEISGTFSLFLLF